MLIELIANHSVPLFMLSLKFFIFFVYCMHEADWSLVDPFDIFQADQYELPKSSQLAALYQNRYCL